MDTTSFGHNDTSETDVASYIQNVMRKAGVEVEDEELQRQMTAELTELLNDFVLEVLVDKLSDGALDELAQIPRSDSTAIQTCLMKHVPDAQNVLADAFALFEEIYLTGASHKSKP
jgi:hypothetical protein